MLAKLMAIFDNVPMMVAFKDTQNNVIAANKYAAVFMEMETQQLSNVHLREIFPNDYERYYSYDLEVIQTKKEKLKFIEKHNKSFIETSVIPILDDKNEVEYLMILMTDITKEYKLSIENKRKEKLLIHQNKLAAMGEMLQNIAHQWRQPLSTISTASTGIKIRKEMGSISDEELISTMDTINNTAQFLSQTINDFRSFINPNDVKLCEFKVNDCIEKTLKFYESKMQSKNIKVIKNIDEIVFLSLENQLSQVLMNIINNAIDVLENIEDTKYIFIDAFKMDGTLYINIKDSAGGIKMEILNKVFEPYFTTKHKSQGTGIGLYMSQEIIRKLLKGRIYVQNDIYSYNDKRHKGACFRIELPLYFN